MPAIVNPRRAAKNCGDVQFDGDYGRDTNENSCNVLQVRAENGSEAQPIVDLLPERTFDKRSRGRRHRDVRAKTIRISKLPRWELEVGRRLFPVLDHERPQTRSDCLDGPRPCPFVACRYHLYLDVARNGSIKLNFPDLEPWQLEPCCALDVADRGGTTLEQVAALMNMTRERVRQLEGPALEKLAPLLTER